MIKNIFIGIFAVVFIIFILDYFKLLPNDHILGLKNITDNQIEQINSFDSRQETEETIKTPEKFTDRVSNTTNQ